MKLQNIFRLNVCNLGSGVEIEIVAENRKVN